MQCNMSNVMVKKLLCCTTLKKLRYFWGVKSQDQKSLKTELSKYIKNRKILLNMI